MQVKQSKCNSCEYAAICVDLEGTPSSKKKRKEVRQRKEFYTKNTTHFFNDRFSKCNATQMMDFRRYFSQTSACRNFDRNLLWPLILLCLVETSITISDKKCKLQRTERLKGVIAFGQNNSLKKKFNYKKNLSSFREELTQVDLITKERFQNCTKLYGASL